MSKIHSKYRQNSNKILIGGFSNNFLCDKYLDNIKSIEPMTSMCQQAIDSCVRFIYIEKIVLFFPCVWLSCCLDARKRINIHSNRLCNGETVYLRKIGFCSLVCMYVFVPLDYMNMRCSQCRTIWIFYSQHNTQFVNISFLLFIEIQN